ncbi:MAG: hypothetical protein K1W22_06360 [Lachnospiraceae bacterium]
MGWNIIFRIGEMAGLLRLVYFFAVECGQMKRNHCNLWELKSMQYKRRLAKKQIEKGCGR